MSFSKMTLVALALSVGFPALASQPAGSVWCESNWGVDYKDVPGETVLNTNTLCGSDAIDYRKTERFIEMYTAGRVYQWNASQKKWLLILNSNGPVDSVAMKPELSPFIFIRPR